ncbi:MAG: oligosaccharide flippase family protein [Paludibacteraceae bacterium]|nr:oligosaccharide flippase family protein [Paludibacteraceae bacterium]
MNRIANILSSPSVRNVGKLLSANVFAQALGLLVYPLLTRMYAPEDFALLNLFTSIVGVLVIVATSEYQYAIVLPEDEKKARSIVHICLCILATVLVIVTLSIPFAKPIAGLFNAPELARYWWLIPLLVLGLSLWNILNYWYIRQKAFTRISGYQMTQSIFAATGKIGLGWSGQLRGGLIIASVMAPLLSLLISVGLSWKKHLSCLLSADWQQIKSAAREYANFPKFNLPRALVNTVGVVLPVWILTPHFGLEQMGYLSLAMLAAFVPLNIIAKACYQVLFQHVSELVQSKKAVRPVVLRFLAWMGGIMGICLTAVYIFVPQLVTILFGAEWIETATIIRRLYPYLMLTPFCGTLCFLSDVFAKQKTAMWLEIGYVTMMLVTLLAGTRYLPFLSAISAYAWVGFGYLFVQLMWFLSIVYRYEKKNEGRIRQ